MNCYLLGAGEGRAVVVDPGAEPEAVVGALERAGVRAAGIVLTHGHFDHVAGLTGLLELLAPEQPPVAIHPADAAALGPRGLAEARRILEGMGAAWVMDGAPESLPEPCILLAEGELPFAPGFVVIHTPGHTPGGICLYSAARGELFSGDTLFRSGVGRTDLPGGDEAALYRSIEGKLLVLPESTKLYPGHGPDSTIGKEKRWFR